MLRRTGLFTGVALSLALLGVAACGGGGDQSAQQEATQEQWAAVEAAHQELQDKRHELEDLQARIDGWDADAAPAEGSGSGGGTGEEAEATTLPELQEQAETLRNEISSLAATFDAQLTKFINDQDIDLDGELTEVQKQALRMKSDEAIVAAQEFIDRGGDYRRAIEIYKQAQAFDPSYDRLQQLIAEAEEMRWMSEERFAAVKKGMSQDEVRSALGQPLLRNIHAYPERGVVAWYYRKKDGGAAGVFFQEKGKKDSGDWRVYKTDYNAIAQQVVGEGGEDEDAGP